MNDLVRAQNMGRGEASAGGTDIQGLSELDKLDSRGVGATEEYRDLKSDPG